MLNRELETRRQRERSEIRFVWLKDLIERLRTERPHLPDEVVDAIYDKVKMKLLEDPDFGLTRGAVWGMIKKQLAWSHGDHQRLIARPDHPRRATSLDRQIVRPDGSVVEVSGLVAAPYSEQPERVVEDRQEVARIREVANSMGPNFERAVIGVMIGVAPARVAEVCGVKENTVHKWMGRFRTIYKATEDGGQGDGYLGRFAAPHRPEVPSSLCQEDQ